jgi:hypothetical protein
MNLSEFIKKELEKGEKLTANEWVEKIKQFDDIEKSRIFALPHEQKNALGAAVSALYFNDNSDYKSALYCVVSHLSGISKLGLDDSAIKTLYDILNPIETNAQKF